MNKFSPEELKLLQAKAKERTVKTQNIEYDLETLVKKINKEYIKLDPDYQRRHRWDKITSSKLIESLILNIPIPTIYISQDYDVDTETEESRFSVIDGQQRLTAIRDFFNNSYELEGLQSLTELNEKKYKDLPPFLIRRLDERTLKCLRIDSTLDAQVKIDIFERLNSGSVKLEPQELRNATQQGKFNSLCIKLSKDENFRRLLQIYPESEKTHTRVKKMEDVELVLRLYSMMNNNYQTYKKTEKLNFKDFLTINLIEGNKLEDAEFDAFEVKFTNTFLRIRTILGDTAFAKYKFTDGEFKRQSKFNAAVYDAFALGFIDTEIETLTAIQKTQLKDLFKDDTFHSAVSGSTTDSSKLSYRIEKVKEILA